MAHSHFRSPSSPPLPHLRPASRSRERHVGVPFVVPTCFKCAGLFHAARVYFTRNHAPAKFSESDAIIRAVAETGHDYFILVL
jgi:hypothetical protein